jgi:hypothetical protein
MTLLLKNNLLIIPNYISIVYYKNKYLIILQYNFKLNFIRLPINNYLIIIKNKIFIIIYQINNNLALLIQKSLFELITKEYKKLNLIGTGYRTNMLTNFGIQVLVFKLGFSHFIYLYINNSIKFLSYQYSNFFIISNTTNIIGNLMLLIKSFKNNNIYNGKGILYYNETVELKKPRII